MCVYCSVSDGVKRIHMDRLGIFLVGVLAGAVGALAIKRLVDDNQISLESLEDSITERLDALEENLQPILN